MPRWRIYYDDGSTFSDEDGSPWEAPTHGVLVIAQRYPSGVKRKCADHYWWRAEWDCWHGGDDYGLKDYLGAPASAKKVLFGRSVPDEVFHRVVEAANADPDFQAVN